ASRSRRRRHAFALRRGVRAADGSVVRRLPAERLSVTSQAPGAASARIVVLGATGFTGRLLAHALVARGLRPVIAGRSPAKVQALSEELGGVESALANTSD